MLSVERSAARLPQRDQETWTKPRTVLARPASVETFAPAASVDTFAERWDGVKGAARDLGQTIRDNPGKTVLLAGGAVAAGVMFPVVAVVMTGVGIAGTGYAAVKTVVSETRATSAAQRGDTDAQRALLRESGRNIFGVTLGVTGVGVGRAASALAKSSVAAQTTTVVKSAAASETLSPTAPQSSIAVVARATSSAKAATDDAAPIRNLGLYRDDARAYVRELRSENGIRTGLFGFERELQDAARAFPTSGERNFQTYLNTRLDVAVGIEKRYWDGIRTVGGRDFDGPRADRALMIRFAQQTELHRRNVDTGLARLTGEGRGFQSPHDVHEVRSLDEVAELASRPDAPQWLRNLVARARAEGQTTYDVGKADPYVIAGMSQMGPAEKYSILLHRLSPHHADTPMSYEGAFDYVNALRMPRFYGTGRVRSFNDIWAIARENASQSRNGMRVEDLPRIQEAMRAHHALEHESLITKYYSRMAPETLPDFMRGVP